MLLKFVYVKPLWKIQKLKKIIFREKLEKLARLLARWHAKLKNCYFFWHVGAASWKIDTLAGGHVFWHAGTLVRGRLNHTGTYGMNGTWFSKLAFFICSFTKQFQYNFSLSIDFFNFYLFIYLFVLKRKFLIKIAHKNLVCAHLNKTSNLFLETHLEKVILSNLMSGTTWWNNS